MIALHVQGKIYTGEHPAEFYKALVGAEKDALHQAPSSKEEQQSIRASGTQHSSTAPTFVLPHRVDHRGEPIATPSHHAEQQVDVGTTTGLGYAVTLRSSHKVLLQVIPCTDLCNPRTAGTDGCSGHSQLLAKSGWKGGGLGRAEQGITSPLPAWHNQGRMGIGSGAQKDPAASSAGDALSSAEHSKLCMQGFGGGMFLDTLPMHCIGASRQQRVTKASQPLGAEEVATGGKGRPQAHSSQRPQQSQRPPKPPKREWASVSVEEPMEVKVARVKQVLQAETDDAAERAFSRNFCRAFSDAGGYGSTDSNPLLRPSKLSKSNPLL